MKSKQVVAALAAVKALFAAMGEAMKFQAAQNRDQYARYKVHLQRHIDTTIQPAFKVAPG